MAPLRPARPVLALAFVLVVLGAVVPAVPASAGPAGVELTPSAPLVELGEPVRLTVALAGADCAAGRSVLLEWRPADSAGFAAVGSGTTASDGTAVFEQVQPHTGRYRATISTASGCAALTSAEALVRVRAFVDASVVTSEGPKGTCADVAASVEPPRPGQLLDLQRRVDGAWTTVQQLPLDATSSAVASPCFGGDDVGVVRLRVRWVAQDPLNETASSPVLAFEVAPAPWMQAIDDAIGAREISVAVGDQDAFWYRHDAAELRIPASNTKLLLSMAFLDALGPDLRIRTSAATAAMTGEGLVQDLWILGRGDPKVGKPTLATLARELVEAGLTRVTGRVLGSTGYFKRDWDAPGWNDVARDYVNRPTALTFEGNDDPEPERRAADVLTLRLEELGVRVDGRPGSGPSPSDLVTLAYVTSKPVPVLLRKLLRPSDNFIAEVLGKRLGVAAAGTPGTIAKGAAAIESFTDGHGADFEINDGSGLSYANRVTAEGIVRLLWFAEDAPWYRVLRQALPTGGQGTLRDRLHGVAVRAKTGTLDEVSALSGWVAMDGGDWLEFSILCSSLSKTTASGIEDEIVEVLAETFG